ncbi:MAG: hypothetical protein LQ348_000875 [Seirophora lacunosa]|nr:MAG: hypothetical protein LQ348_000875 [Seirophora lacunosa]
MIWHPFLLDSSFLERYTTVPKPSFSCFLRSSSPFQLRDRLSRASALIRSFSAPDAHQAADVPLPPTSSPPSTLKTASEPVPPTLTPPPLYASAFLPQTLHPLQFPHAKHDDSPITTTTTTPSTGIDITNLNVEYAQQGLSLLRTSLSSLAQNPAFARQLYIHALVYLLQGLPAPATSLAEHELASLRSAIPHAVFPAAAVTTTTTTALPPGDQRLDDNNDLSSKARRNRRPSIADDPANQQGPPPPPPSLLHRALSILVFLLLSAAQRLRPCLHALLSTLVSYDERYGIRAGATAGCWAVGRSVWVWATENVDPRLLIWFGSEVATGVGEGWRRGLRDPAMS